MILSLMSLTVIANVVGPFWRVPLRFYQWSRSKPTEPAVDQVWSQALITTTDRQWKITETENGYIALESLTQEDWKGDPLTNLMDSQTWQNDFVRRGRGFCLDRNDTVYDEFWGDAA